MTDVILRVANVGKSYREYSSEWWRFAGWFGLASSRFKEHWVLRHVDFSIHRGEAIGIVGQNGAGKSTLLKMITGTLHPTEGGVSVGGRIAAILELGMGFDPNLTGRQNVWHSGGLMGLTRADIESVMPDIEAFAEIGAYFDEPLRTYSSGMQMRVAFSLATAVRPDILIVDEALSVGDAYFVHKCFARIKGFREQGTTLLIVSHDRSAVLSLCDRAVLLDRGRMLLDSQPQEVIDYYNAIIAERESKTIRQERRDDGGVATVSGTGEATIADVQLLDANGAVTELVGVGDSVTLSVRVHANADIPSLVIGYVIKDRLGQSVFGTNTHHTGHGLTNVRKGRNYSFEVRFPMNIGVGTYSVSIALSSTETHLVNNYEWKDLALVFTVANVSRPMFVGVAWNPPEELSIRELPG
ncbi:ABC transporter ATP-binding protein [Dyella soli]|uniref:ABC transporter ATP-binding protein n=1 Tax=Dyella soli TaxID=522319 RepID=A0A4R0YWX3_9GAMM|nr:ABC transporter ATP-binding protein [Dyella soli]TCI11132.1 ABC transporter ATP-binding protein [Dyella soli]